MNELLENFEFWNKLDPITQTKYTYYILTAVLLLTIWRAFKTWQELSYSQQRVRIVFISLLVIGLIVIGINLFLENLFGVAFILIVISSYEGIVYNVITAFSKDFDTQIAFGKRLADWFEKMSAAIFVGCLINFLQSDAPPADIPINPNLLSTAQFKLVGVGAIGVITTLYVSIRLTIYLNQWISMRNKDASTKQSVRRCSKTPRKAKVPCRYNRRAPRHYFSPK